MHENEISYLIRQAAYNVHVALGPGLLESAYEAALMHELRLVGLRVQNQVALPMVYKDIQLEVGYRLDLLVEGKVVVELKTVDAVLDIHHMQLLTYLRLSGHRLGLLINFNVPPHQRRPLPKSKRPNGLEPSATLPRSPQRLLR